MEENVHAHVNSTKNLIWKYNFQDKFFAKEKRLFCPYIFLKRIFGLTSKISHQPILLPLQARF